VLFALDQIDEIALQGVGTFEEMEVIDAAKENVDLGEQSDAEKQADSAAKEEFKEVCEYLKETLGMQVDKCEVSARLTKAPCALVQPQWGVSPQMQRFMRAQAAAAGTDETDMGMASNLEINPKHPAVLKLKGMVEAERSSPATKDFASLVFDVAAVSSGYEIKDTAAFATRVISLMSEGVDMAGWLKDAETGTAAPREQPAAVFTTESAPNVVEAKASEGELPQDIEVITPEQDGVESWYDSGERM